MPKWLDLQLHNPVKNSDNWEHCHGHAQINKRQMFCLLWMALNTQDMQGIFMKDISWKDTVKIYLG